MSSRDNTLLSKLGFQDPDRREPMHDLACEYLAMPENMTRVWRGVYPELDKKWLESARKSVKGTYYDTWETVATTEGDVLPELVVSTKTEVAVGAPYVAGFIDVAGYVDLKLKHKDPSVSMDSYLFNVFIEVKISPCGAGDLIRQINMYRAKLYPDQYKGIPCRDPRARAKQVWFLAVPAGWKLPPADLLKRENIRTISLGKGFTDWVAARQQSTITDIEL